MGFFSGLNAEKYDRQYTDRQLVGRILDYFKPQLSRLAWISVLVLGFAGVGASLPVVVGRAVDLVRAQPAVQTIAIFGLGLVVIAFGNWGLNWARRALVARAVG